MRSTLIEEEMIRIPVTVPVVVKHKEQVIVKDRKFDPPKERRKPGRKKGWKRALENSTAVDLSTLTSMCGRGKGSIPMSIPESLMPEFCRRISAAGTRARLDVINGFSKDYPETSMRQAQIKFTEVTTRDRPSCIPPPGKTTGRSILFYLRPRYYHMLDENERPENWEEFAKEDELKWQEEQDAKELSAAKNDEDRSTVSDGEYEEHSTSVHSTMDTTFYSDDDG